MLASTVLHAAVVIVASFFFIDGQPAPDHINTAGSFQDEPPAGVTTLIEEEAVLVAAPASESLLGNPAAAATTVLPRESTELLPQGLGTEADSENAVATTTALAPGVAAAVAEIQERVTQAGGKSGEVQFSLSWHNRNDLDLHVVVPNGKRIYFKSRRSTCGGHLDVDMNVTPESDQPVENVRWLKGKARSGRYTVYVNFFRAHQPTNGVPFELVAKLGPEVKLIEERTGFGKQLLVFRFIYIRPTVSAKRRPGELRKFQKLQEDEERVAGELLRKATANGAPDMQKISIVAFEYPHTDAALRALQMLPGKATK